MEVHTVHNREPFPGWDSRLGLGVCGECLCGQKPGGLKSQRRVLSKGVTQSNEV